MAVVEPERCFICNKVFCCNICCEKHIENKHSKLTCPICQGIPLRIRRKCNSKLIKHLAENHLPLQCITCCQVLQNSEDLVRITACNDHPIIYVQSPTLIDINQSNHEEYISLNQTSIWLNSKESSISGDSNYQPRWITSPPEFKRFTSTPMQVGLHRGTSNIFNISVHPNFSSGSSQIITSPREQTPLQSILILKSLKEQKNLSRINLQELADEATSVQQTNKDLKRVRFSINCQDIMETKNSNLSVLDDSISEEFFEARQSLSPMSVRQTNRDIDVEKKNHDDVNTRHNGTYKSSSKVMVTVIMEKNSANDCSNDANNLMSLVNAELKNIEYTDDFKSSTENRVSILKKRSVVSGHKYVKVAMVERREVSTFIDKKEKSGKILSTITNAVNSAFKTLSGVVSAITWGDDQLDNKENLPNFQEDNLEIPISRTAKRPREQLEVMTDNILPDTDAPEENRIYNNIRSPLQKKLRSGYVRIRGREPIARMKNFNLARGISSETQCYQQDAHTVGETVMPLPPRAQRNGAMLN